jgi:hypothetical protein
LRWNQSVAGSNATFTGIQQRIESVRTFAGRQVRVSFYAKAASALTLPSIGFKQAFGTGGTPSPDVTTLLASSVSITTSWQKFSYAVTVPSITAQTLGTDGNDSLILDLGLPLNAAYTFDLSQVQVELGPIATPFERRPIGAELALCQRYYCTTTASVRGYVAATAQGVGASFYWPVEMRNTPTLTDSGGSLTNVSAVTVDLADKNSAMMRVSATTAPGYVYVAGRTITASAEI